MAMQQQAAGTRAFIATQEMGMKGAPDDWGKILQTLGNVALSIVSPLIPGGGYIAEGVQLAEHLIPSGQGQPLPSIAPTARPQVQRQVPPSQSLPGAGANIGGPQPTPPNTHFPGGRRLHHPRKQRLQHVRHSRRRH